MAKDLGAEALAAVKKHGSRTAAAKALGIPRTTLISRLDTAENRGNAAPETPDQERAKLHDQIYELQQQLKSRKGSDLNEEYVKRKIIGLTEAVETHIAPKWLVTARIRQRTARCADAVLQRLALGREGVQDAAQRRQRIRHADRAASARGGCSRPRSICCAITRSIRSTQASWCALGGDMLTGDIHDELTETNDAPTAVALLDIYGVLRVGHHEIADEFGMVFLPCVAGNHGRFTKKPRSKNRNVHQLRLAAVPVPRQALRGRQARALLHPRRPGRAIPRVRPPLSAHARRSVPRR
jgi:hypothetical protein